MTHILALALTVWLAHPGHGEVSIMSGKVLAIEAERIQLDVFDRASFSNKKIWVLVDAATTVQYGKVRLQLTDLTRGQEVECMAETEEGRDGTTVSRALQIRFKKPYQ